MSIIRIAYLVFINDRIEGNSLAYSPDHDGLVQGSGQEEHVVVGEVQRVDVPKQVFSF